MKPSLATSLLAFVLAATASHADYSGGQILNETGYSGSINIEFNDSDTVYEHGAVERSGPAGSNGSTTIGGNITISAGKDYQDSQDTHLNHGVYIGPDIVNDSNSEATSDAAITLKTNGADDQIIIDVYGKNSSAVRNNSTSSTITLDASSSDSRIIRLTQHHNGEHKVLASYGKIEVIGNLDITSNGTGWYAHGISAMGEYSDITITGNTTITMLGEESVALSVANNFRAAGTLTIDSKGHGIFASSTNTTFDNSVNITTTKNGVATDAAALTFNSAIRISSSSENGIYTKNGGSITLNAGGCVSGTYNALYANASAITLNEGQYAISGNIMATGANAVMEISMNGQSRFTGSTIFLEGNEAGIINLGLQGQSLWNVTGNSQLTSLTLGQGSALQLAFSGTSLTDIITATGTITLEAGSVIYLTGDLSGLQGGSFDFFDGTLVNNGVKFIGFDGTEWVEYDYTQTGANTFAFSASAPLVIDEPGFIPEPATATLGLLGLASLLTRRRRA